MNLSRIRRSRGADKDSEGEIGDLPSYVSNAVVLSEHLPLISQE